MQKNFKYIISIVALIGGIVSLILLKHHVDFSYKSPLCGVSENNGCNVLNRSDISEIFGIPLAYFGYVYYGFVVFLGLYSDRGKSFSKIIFILSVIAMITDLGLLSYSILEAETICTLCAITYAATLVILILSYLKVLNNKSGFIPDLNEWQTEKVSMKQVIFILSVLILVSGGFFNYAYSSGTKGSSVSSRGSYVDHLIIAENEYIKAYENSPEKQFKYNPLSKKGPIKGLINIVEFADYLCPHCRHMAEELDRFMKKYPDEVSFTFRHYPLDQACNPAITRPFHQGSCLLAYASYCALKQNRFWDLHHYIFDNQDALIKGVSKDDALNLSAAVGLSRTMISACMDDMGTKQAIDNDVQEANDMGINGTPTIYIDGRKMDFNDFLVERLMLYKKRKDSQRTH
ncbi:MAG: thioredoxin domain-containing protein [Spirochaetia bacterium]|nr:thioredoxin domain-containing protein [Spirochaetia bacterium]